MKKKDYLRLFLSYCKNNNIWFSICTDGSIDTLSYFHDFGTNFEEMVDFEAPGNFKLGSKAAYEWLKREIAEIKQDNKPCITVRK
jgi:hypothetical protein